MMRSETGPIQGCALAVYGVRLQSQIRLLYTGFQTIGSQRSKYRHPIFQPGFRTPGLPVINYDANR